MIRLADSTLWGIIGNLHLQKVLKNKDKKYEYPIMSERNLLLELMNGMK
jgi:hypothetical protein